ncbi:MAG: hypothetical protein QM817_30075 [Archangium sp.]
MKRRGHVLLLVMVAIVVAITLVTVFLTRFSIADAGRRDASARTQAMWLARSACLSGFSGKLSDVSTRAGKAQVSRSSTSAEVSVGGTRVELDCTTGAPRY